MSKNIYQHYRPDEVDFIDSVFDWASQVTNSYIPYTTNFLTPRQATIIKELIAGYDDLDLGLCGGYKSSERKRALILPPYYQAQKSDWQLALLEIDYPKRFGELSHGAILGTLMSSGLDRDRIGDIITDKKNWQVIVDKTISNYLVQQVTKISNIGVELKEIPFEQIIEPVVDWQTKQVYASSLRLDTLLANVYNLSRSRSQTLIKQGATKVNFTPTEEVNLLIESGDIVSVRGYGRFWINDIQGKTRKGNYRLEIHVIKN